MKRFFSVLLCLMLAMSMFACSAPADTPRQVAEGDLTTQVLVVGSGLAGLATAVSVREQVAECIVVEKMSMTGGTSRLSGGGIAAAGSKLQKALGIEDSPEAYVKQWMEFQAMTRREGMENPDEARCLFIAKQGSDIIDWLMSYGYEFGNPTSFGLIEGVDRFHYPNNLPEGQVGKMTEVAEELGATILLDTRATSLIVENDKVVGATVTQKDKTFNIYADAVVLATGGYSQNEELIAELTPENSNTLHAASPGSTGDGLIMAREIGAALYKNQWLMGLSYAVSADHSNTLNNLGGPWTINMMVDKTGTRFMNEFSHPTAYTMMITRNAGPYYSIYDSSDADNAAILTENEGSEYLIKGETLEELAKNAGFDVDAFLGFVEDWNNGIDAGQDSFGARIDYMSKLQTGPFYAVRMTPQNMDSMGGIVTDLEARVLREDGSAIAGLYAAGAISNGALYDTAYMSGSAVLNCYVMGRIAGRNAAADAK
ncbi:MAG: FAD-binding protein [Christensenellales bacterium]|jgi:flavocytochrome c